LLRVNFLTQIILKLKSFLSHLCAFVEEPLRVRRIA